MQSTGQGPEGPVFLSACLPAVLGILRPLSSCWAGSGFCCLHRLISAQGCLWLILRTCHFLSFVPSLTSSIFLPLGSRRNVALLRSLWLQPTEAPQTPAVAGWSVCSSHLWRKPPLMEATVMEAAPTRQPRPCEEGKFGCGCARENACETRVLAP